MFAWENISKKLQANLAIKFLLCLTSKASFAAECQVSVLFYRSKSDRIDLLRRLGTMLAHAILNLPSLGPLVRASIPPPGTLQSFTASQELWCQRFRCWHQCAFRRHATMERRIENTADGRKKKLRLQEVGAAQKVSGSHFLNCSSPKPKHIQDSSMVLCAWVAQRKTLRFDMK